MEGKLRIPLTVLSALQLAVTQLHRLVGGAIKITRLIRTKDDRSLKIVSMVHVRFMNRGQTSILIDNQIVLFPGEVYVEGDNISLGVDHVYDIQFLSLQKNGIPEPAEQIPYTMPHNYLDVRIMQRIY